MRDAEPRSDIYLTTAATATSVVTTMPVFLVGALGVAIAHTLDITLVAFGSAISVFFIAAALASVPGGYVARRLGGGRTILLCVAATSITFVGLATMPSAVWLVTFMCLGGVVHGIAQPATDLVLASSSPNLKLAFRFSIKQASVPAAILLSGVSIPLVASTVGWRWAFGIAVGMCLALAAVLLSKGIAKIPKVRLPAGTPHTQRRLGAHLVILAAAIGLGVAAATAFTSFLPHTVAAAGLGQDTAGWLLAAGSVVGIGSRLAAGWFLGADGSKALTAVGAMLCIGAGGYALLALGTGASIAAGTAITFGIGWGWAGLLHFAVVVLHPSAPSVASGIVQSGAASGAALGPFTFGLLASTSDYSRAWNTAAAAALVAGVAVLAIRTWMRPARR